VLASVPNVHWVLLHPSHFYQTTRRHIPDIILYLFANQTPVSHSKATLHHIISTLRDFSLFQVRIAHATKVSQLKICDFSGEIFKRFEVL